MLKTKANKKTGNKRVSNTVENNNTVKEKINRLLSVIGTAKNKNKVFDKQEVYDQ